MSNTLRVLILEDRSTDVELMLYQLRRAGFALEWQNVQTEKDYVDKLDDDCDIILADFTLPQFNALNALHILQERGHDIPFIVVTGSISEEIAVQCMKEGAADYLLKDRLARLGQAVNRALEEKKLRQSKWEVEERYRQMFEKNNAVKLLIDPGSGLIVEANPAACEFYGYNREQLISMSIIDIDVLDEENLIEDLEGTNPSDESTYFVSRHRLASGEIRDIEAYTGPIDVGGEKLLFSIIHDITERKKAEAALKHSEERFRALIENSMDLIAIMDENGVINYASPSFDRVLGYQTGEVLGKNWFKSVHPDDIEFVRQVFDLVLQNPGKVMAAEYRVKDKSGAWRILETTGKNLLDDPIVHGIVGTGRDVTERRLLEEEQRRTELMRIELEKEREVVALRDQFISTVSHQFKTPLAVMKISGSSLARYYDRHTPEKRKELINEMIGQIDHMTDLVNDVLTVRQSQAGMLSCNPEPVNLESFCHNLIEQLHLIDNAVHIFRFENHVGTESFLIDKKLLQHVLMNLLENAIKYSPNGGEISLKLTCENQQLAFRVSDQGMGIPAEAQKHLFDPFFRAKNAKEIKGTGLGLSIVKNSVEACGGNIDFESAEGQGTTFIVSLPVS